MAWFAFNENSARSLRKSQTTKNIGVTLREGNPLMEALASKESILILPGTVAESPFLLHIQNRGANQPAHSAKKWWKWR